MYLVTGAAGFIGSHLVEHLTAAGKNVRRLVRSSNSRANSFDGTETVVGDLVTEQGIQSAFRDVHTVFHIAGVVKAKSPEGYYAGNARATENAVKKAVNAGVRRFVHISSVAAVGPSCGGEILTEDSPARPISTYGRSKLEGEMMVRNSPLEERAVIVRPSAVYGPRDRDLFQFFRAVQRGRLFQVGERDCRFQLIYVKDLVEALVQAGESEVSGGQTYFVAHPESVSWTELGMIAASIMQRQVRKLRIPVGVLTALASMAEMFSRISGKPNALTVDQIREAATDWRCSTAAAERDLHFAPRWSLQRGVEDTLKWYKDEGWIGF